MLQDPVSSAGLGLWRQLIFNPFSKLHRHNLQAEVDALKAANARLLLEKEVAFKASSAAGLTAAELFFIRNKLR